MALAPETQKIVDGLTSLKETIQKKGQVEKEIERNKAKIQKLETDAKNSGDRIDKLPTNNCNKTEASFRSIRIADHDKKESLVMIVLNALIVILGIFMIVTLFSHASAAGALPTTEETVPTEIVSTEVVAEEEGGETGIQFIAAVFSIIATVALLVYANTDAWSIYEEIWDVFSVSGILFFVFCWWAPFISILMSIAGLALVNVALIPIPIIMVICMVIRKNYLRNGMNMKPVRFTAEEQAQIDAAAALDRENDQKNMQMMRETVAMKTEEIRQPVAELKEKISQLQAELSTLKHQIDDNDYLGPKQLENLDKILQLLRDRDADTVKEALNKIEEEKRLQSILMQQKLERERMELENKKRNSPGTVMVEVTEDGKGKNADVYVDGQYYGNISYLTGFTVLTLNPGAHNVAVIAHSCGQSFRSAPHSFYLEGGSTVTLKFLLQAYFNRVVCIQV